MRKFWRFVLFFPLMIGACSEKEFDPNDPAGSFAIARESYDDEDYDRAITRLGEFKSRFPYSQYAVQAELFIANSHYELGHYDDAAVAYEQFVKLHPKHEQLDYAMFRVGECYWQDAQEAVDRDQEFTRKAVEEWEKLVAKLPKSPYSKKAAKLIKDGRIRIAGNMEFVARFYCKQELYHACAYRYILLAEEFPYLKSVRKEALLTAADALDRVAEEKRLDPKSDKNIYANTMTADEIVKKARRLRKEAGGE